MDYSTLNLTGLPEAKIAPTYRIGKAMGMCCFMDPPGYPSYFLQSVYTRYGNDPERGPSVVIRDADGTYRTVSKAQDPYDETTRDRRLRKLWNPLPLDHPRTEAWIVAVYRHFHSMYTDPDAPEGYTTKMGPGNERQFVFPVPAYKLRSFRDDHRFSDEWRSKEKAAVEAYNAEVIAYFAARATPENAGPVRFIRKFYPEHEPRVDWLAPNSPPPGTGSWWETEAERPTPETCRPRSCGPHPVNKTCCQWCGWRKEEG